MKIALFYSGLIRSYPDIYKSIETILDIDSVDMYFHTWEGQEEIDFLINSRSWRNYIIEKSNFLNSNYAKGFYSKKAAFELTKKEKYDFIIYSRFDSYYWPESKKINYQTLKKTLHILPYCNWYGLEDRFAIGPEDYMEAWSTCFEDHQNKVLDFDSISHGIGEWIVAQYYFRKKNDYQYLKHIKTSIIADFNQENILLSKRCTPQFTGDENHVGEIDWHDLYKNICHMELR